MKREKLIIDRVECHLYQREHKDGRLVWYVGIMEEKRPGRRRRYLQVKSTGETVRQKAVDAAYSIVERYHAAPGGKQSLRAFIEGMWTPGSRFLELRRHHRQPGKRIGDQHARNSLRWLENHFLPYCERSKVNTFEDLTPEFLTDWILELKKHGRVIDSAPVVGLSTVEKVRKMLNVTLKYAVAQKVIRVNPLSGLDDLQIGYTPEEQEEHTREHIPIEELRRILQPVLWAESWAYAMAVIATVTGAREGELRALRWGDVDLDTGTIRIERSWSNYSNSAKLPKSRKGRRIRKLGRHPLQVVTEYHAAAKYTGEDDLLFPGTVKRDLPVSAGRAVYHLRQAATRAGVTLDPKRHTFHSLRHTYASYMAGEMTDQERRDALGHADQATTDGYTHDTEVGRDREAQFWEQRLFTIVKNVG